MHPMILDPHWVGKEYFVKRLFFSSDVKEPNWFANTFCQKLNLASKALDQSRLDYRLILCTGDTF